MPEGSHVEAGTVVCELDATALIEKRFQQSISLRNAEAAFVKAKQNFEIQQSQNRSDIAKAEQKLEFAGMDLDKYTEGERASMLEKAKQAIDLAKEDFTRASNKLDWSEKLAEKGFLTATELEADKISRNRARVLLEQATRESELLDKFQLPRMAKELDAARVEATFELDRVKRDSRVFFSRDYAITAALDVAQRLRRDLLVHDAAGQVELVVLYAENSMTDAGVGRWKRKRTPRRVQPHAA